MKRETYMFGVRGQKYGIWNAVAKQFQFGICEDTPMLAEARLTQHIGDDARKWRFEAKVLPKELREKLETEPKQTALTIELTRKDQEIKQLRKQINQLMTSSHTMDRPV